MQIESSLCESKFIYVVCKLVNNLFANIIFSVILWKYKKNIFKWWALFNFCFIKVEYSIKWIGVYICCMQRLFFHYWSLILIFFPYSSNVLRNDLDVWMFQLLNFEFILPYVIEIIKWPQRLSMPYASSFIMSVFQPGKI